MRERGATIVEAAVAVLVIFMLIFGMFEFGRFLIINATVTNASREAARYATTSGDGLGGVPRYADCDGMRAAAKELGVLGTPTDGQITLEYDEGPGDPVFLTCAGSTVTPGEIETGDRIVVTVAVPFNTAIPLFDQLLDNSMISVQTIRTISTGA